MYQSDSLLPFLLALSSIVPVSGAGFCNAASVQSEAEDVTEEQLAALHGELLFLLQGQRATLSTAFIRYEETFVATDGGFDPPRCVGWWARNGERTTSVRWHGGVAETGAKPGWQWANWNGATLQSSRGASSEELGANPVVSYVQVGPHQVNGALSYFIGGPFGLYYWHEVWADLVDPAAVDARPIGVEVVEGRRCLGILFDYHPLGSIKDGAYKIPVIAWFDLSGAAFAVRIEEFVTDSVAKSVAGKSSSEPTAYMRRHSSIPELEGFCIGNEIQMADFRPVKGCGFTIPWKATFTSHHLRGIYPVATARCTHVDLRLRDEFTAAPTVSIRYPLTIHDQSTGRRFVLGREGEAPVSYADLEYWLICQQFAESFGRQPRRDVEPVSGGDANCAIDVAVFLGLVFSPEPATRLELLQRLKQGERTEGRTSFDATAKLLQSIGLTGSVARSVPFEQWRKSARPVVVSLVGDDGHVHYAVVIPRKDAAIVDVIQPPSEVSALSAAKLKALWTGDVYYVGAE